MRRKITSLNEIEGKLCYYNNNFDVNIACMCWFAFLNAHFLAFTTRKFELCTVVLLL